MAKRNSRQATEDIQDHYDFSRGVRGKYAASFAERTNLIALDPDVAAVFPDSKSVNDALRNLTEVARRAAGKKVA